MKSTFWQTTCVPVTAALTVLVTHTGCTDAPGRSRVEKKSADAVKGAKTIAFHVPQMSKRLKLL